jgi:site-specific DNA recombinase
MTTSKLSTKTDIYLRLSDMRVEDALDGREARLRAEAARLGWDVHRVIIENDLSANGQASAWKRRRIITPSGRVEYRTVRPGFRDHLLPDLMCGVNLLAEDLDRLVRQPRDGEDLLDAVELSGVSARSLSGSLTLTSGGTDAERMTARIMAAVANKSSSDTARRVAYGRERWAGKSYHGGRRMFGFRHVKGTEEHQRTLAIDEAEAEVIRSAASDILDRSISLAAIARDLRERHVPTVTGTAWTASTLRDVLSKPAVAGIAMHRGTEHPAPWPAILDRDVWQRLTDLFSSRKVSTSPAPKWLVSCYATCGVCGGTTKVTGKEGSRHYVCTGHGHVRRNAVKVDEMIAGLVVARLSQPDVVSILRPPARQGTDTSALRDEARKLRTRKTKLGALYAEGLIDDDQLASGTRSIRDQLARIDAQLAVSDVPDPLAEFRTDPAAVVWESLSVARRREVVKLLMSVEFVRTDVRRGFDPESVVITPLV